MQNPTHVAGKVKQCVQSTGSEIQAGSENFNIVIINDLHVREEAGGEKHGANHNGNGHFEAMFERFISNLESESERRGNRWRLIIAGDMVDFLQVTKVPDQPMFDLRKSEREYGLGTSPEKTAWKMKVLMQDNRRFFQTLARFLSRGNKCTIISGNHDIEWTIPEAQRVFRTEMMKYLPINGAQHDRTLADGIEFCPWFYYEPGLVWVEHGHQYDGMNSFDHLFAPYLPNSRELMLPAGSLFVRYLLNKFGRRNCYDYDLKSSFDYARQYVSSFLSVKNLFKHVRNFPNMVENVRGFKGKDLDSLRERNELGLVAEAKRFGIDEGKLRALRQLWVPSLLYNKGRFENLKWMVTYNVGSIWRRMAFHIQKELRVRYVVFGHTHRAESLLLTPDGSAKYANSGAWTKGISHIPSEKRSRKDGRLMYIQIFREQDNRLALMKWRDDRSVAEPVRIRGRAPGWV